MAGYQINADISWTSKNFDQLMSKLETRVKSFPPIRVKLDVNNLRLLTTYLKGIEDIVSRISKLGALKNLTGPLSSMLGPTKAATQGMKTFKTSVVAVETEIERLGRTSAQTVRRFGAFLVVSNIFNTISNSLREGVHRAVEFDKEFTKISQVTGLSTKNLSALNNEITRLATGLGVSSSKLNEVALILAQAGLSAQDTKTALGALAKTELSATFDDIKNTTEGTIALFQQFKLGAKELEQELSSINTVSAKFAVESSDLVAVLRKAGGAFAAVGADTKDLYSLFTAIRATTRESADSIATGLRTIATRLQRPRTLNFLQELGIDLRDAKGHFIGLYPAVQKLSEALKDLPGSDPRFSSILEEVGGYRQISRLIPLIKNFNEAERVKASLTANNNSLTKDAVVAQQSLANAISKTVEEFDALIRKIVSDNSFQLFARTALKIASAFIQVADSIRPILPLLTTLGTLYAGFATAKIGKSFVNEFLPSSKVKQTIRRARGGIVPGVGNGDTVPAMLEPGEFVVRKKAVEAIGTGNLHQINRYANGGEVQKFGIGGPVRGKLQNILQILFGKRKRKLPIKKQEERAVHEFLVGKGYNPRNSVEGFNIANSRLDELRKQSDEEFFRRFGERRYASGGLVSSIRNGAKRFGSAISRGIGNVLDSNPQPARLTRFGQHLHDNYLPRFLQSDTTPTYSSDHFLSSYPDGLHLRKMLGSSASGIFRGGKNVLSSLGRGAKRLGSSVYGGIGAGIRGFGSSLGLDVSSFRNAFWGSPNYGNSPRAYYPLPYQSLVSRPTGKSLPIGTPPSPTSIPPLPIDEPASPVPVDWDDDVGLVYGARKRKFRKRNPQDLYFKTKNHSLKLLSKKILEDIQKKTGIDPTKILRGFSIHDIYKDEYGPRPTVAGSHDYYPLTNNGHIKLFKSGLREKNNGQSLSIHGRAPGVRGTLSHEFGHGIDKGLRVHPSDVPSSHQNKIAAIYKEIFGPKLQAAGIFHQEHIDYRMQNNEAFADAFALFLYDKKYLKQHATKEQYRKLNGYFHSIFNEEKLKTRLNFTNRSIDDLVGLKRKKFGTGGIAKIFAKNRSVTGIKDRAELRKYLGEFQDKTGINPAAFTNKVFVDNQLDSLGAFSPHNRNVGVSRVGINNRNLEINNARRINRRLLTKNKNIKQILFHELGHSLDIRPGQYTPTSHTIGTRESGLADIYQGIHADTLYRKKMAVADPDFFGYLNRKEELFADFTSDYLTGSFSRDLRSHAARNRWTKSDYKKIRDYVDQEMKGLLSEFSGVQTSGNINDVIGVRGKLKKRFAIGGGVPGSGDSDTVPALLTPGEFVINKESAKTFGYNNLHKINKYATGGPVTHKSGRPISDITDELRQGVPKKSLRKTLTGGGSLNQGLLATGLFLGPQVLSTLGGSLLGSGSGNNEGPSELQQGFDRLIQAVTLAGGSLLAFSALVRKDVSPQVIKGKQLGQDIANITNKQQAIAKAEKLQETRIEEAFNAKIAKQQQILQQNTTRDPNGFIQYNKKAKAAYDRIDELKQQKRDKIADIPKGYQADKDQLDKERKRATKEAAENAKELKKQRESNTLLTQKVVVAASVIAGGGAFLSGTAHDRISRGLGDRSTAIAAGVGGGLTGAALGGVGAASITSAIPALAKYSLPAAIISSIVVGLGSFATSLISANAELDKFSDSKNVSKISEVLADVNSGRTPLNLKKGEIDTFVTGANKELINKQNAYRNRFVPDFIYNDIDDFKQSMSQANDALQVHLEGLIKSGKSAEDLYKENEQLILFLANFGGQSIPELEKRIKEVSASLGKANKIQDEFGRLMQENSERLSALFSIAGAVGNAERAAAKVGNRVDVSDRLINGGTTGANFDFSSLTEIGTAKLSDVIEQATRAGGLIGGQGNALAKDVIAAAETARKIPSILNEIVYSQDLGEEDITERLRQKLGKGFAPDLILERFNQILGNTQNSGEFIKEFKKNPVQVINELQNSLSPIVDVLKDAAPRIQDAINKYADGLTKSRENFFAHLDGLISSIDVAEFGAEVEERLTGINQTFSQRQGFDDSRFNLLGGGRNVSELGARLNVLNSDRRLFENQKAASTDTDELQALTEAISENTKESDQVKKALEFAGDTTSRLIAINKEIEKIEKSREIRKDIATGYVFGSPQEKREILKNIAGAGIITSNLENGRNAFDNVSPQLAKGALDVFRQFSDIKAFAGKTGQERIDEVLKQQGFNIGLTTDEQKSADIARQKIQDSIDAGNILNKNLESINNQFIKDLRVEFETFNKELLASLKEALAESEKEIESTRQAKISGIDAKIGGLKDIQRIFGVNANRKDEVAGLIGKIPIAEKLRGIQQTMADIGKISDKFAKTGNITGFELAKAVGAENVATFNRYDATDIAGRVNFVKDMSTKQSQKLQSEYSTLYNTEIVDKYGEKTAAAVITNLDLLKNLAVLLENVSSLVDARNEKDKIIQGRATGGPIWNKQGTDTVPAMTTDGQPYMLTPGEFIMNRRAVSKYGRSTLEKMNYAANGSYIDFYGKRPTTTTLPGQIVPTEQELSLRKLIAYNKANPGGLTQAEKSRAAAQTARHKANIAAAQIRRGFIPGSSGTTVPFNSLPNYNYVDYNFKNNPSQYMSTLRGKFGGYDPSRTKAPSGEPVSRGFNSNERAIYVKARQRAYAEARRNKENITSANKIAHEAGLNAIKTGGDSQKFNSPLSINPTGQQATLQNQQSPKIINGANPVNSANPTANPVNPMGNQVTLTPDIIKDFNKAVDKLAGSKLEISLNGTLNVNISEGSLGDKVKDSLKVFAETYVMEKVNNAINDLIKEAGLPVLPKAGKKVTK